jgi:hypothetical protein
MTTKTTPAPKDLVDWLDYYLVAKAPVQLPDNAKEWIVRYSPWITIVAMVLALPPLLFVFGIGAALTPFGGLGYATGFTYQAIGALVEIGLIIAALPGLFARKMSSWQLLFYAALISFVFELLSGAVVGGIVGALISLYILFQVRTLYCE